MSTGRASLSLVLSLLVQVGHCLCAQAPTHPAVKLLAWPAPPAPPRIKWVAEYRSALDVGARKRRPFLEWLAGKTEEVFWLNRPLSVAVDEQGVIFIGDYTKGIVVMDPVKKAVWEFSSANGNVLPTPTGLAVDSKLLYATSANSDQVLIFDKKGRLLEGLGKTEGINRPVGIAVDESRDLLIVVNSQEHAVRLYSRSLRLIKTIGERGSGNGQFNMPSYVCIIPNVGFAVSDSGNFRIQIFDFNGQFLLSFGKAGDGPGEFGRPKGIAADPDGHLYVVDGVLNSLQVFDLEGQVLLQVGESGPEKGQFRIPNGLWIDPKGAIYVADQLNARIQRFQYLQLEKRERVPNGQ